MKKAYLVMSDGRMFTGKPLGAIGETSGEVVFNTSMMGYQEILTDPSYEGQIVMMTYPLIGNCGVNDEDAESCDIFAEGFIVKEESAIASNWRKTKTLGDYLCEHNVVGIQGIDTRALTRHIREKGAQPAIISSLPDADVNELKTRAVKVAGTDGVDLVSKVTCTGPYSWDGGVWDIEKGFSLPRGEPKYKVVAIDYGIKRNILRHLVNADCEVLVVPASMTADDILAKNPDGIFLSNGPGDPSAVPYAAETVKGLIGKKPVFGICFGHQTLCRALGMDTYKLKFGHHGGNQPVMDLSTRKVEITAQNHNYAVDESSLPDGVEVTHVNLNDKTVEGIKSDKLKLFSVQYHPEASPGPNDSQYLFKRFTDLMEKLYG